MFTLITVSDECYLYWKLILNFQCLTWLSVTANWIMFIVCDSSFSPMPVGRKEEGVITYWYMGWSCLCPIMSFSARTSSYHWGPYLQEGTSDWFVDWFVYLENPSVKRRLLLLCARHCFRHWGKNWEKKMRFLSFQERPPSSQNILLYTHTINKGSLEQYNPLSNISKLGHV